MLTSFLGDSQLIVVTNREPYRLRRSRAKGPRLEQTTGGLVSALVPVVAASRGTWVAWNPGTRLESESLSATIDHELALVPVSASEVEHYYRGLANGALWPLCHYAIDRCRFSASDWKAYAAVNGKFAARVAAQAAPGSLVWIHDYHLMLVPELIRSRLPAGCRIAYFHHIPFPAPEVFRVLPWWREIITGLLGADTIGFHTPEYVNNFLAACRELDHVRVSVDSASVRVKGHRARVQHQPIGIDTDEFERLSRETQVTRSAKTIRAGLGVQTLLLGVDRLDYTKGIEQRLAMIDHLLKNWPRLRGHISLLQIAVPSRTRVPEYSRFKRHVDELIGRINGKYAENGWQPIHCVYRSVSRRKLVAHYLAADIALVTPLRDGMNLVAKEFCASRTDDNGVLVLSEFAGASASLHDGALIVNPFDTAGFARAVALALALEPDDRRRRMRTLRKAVARSNIYEWTQRVLDHASGDLPQRTSLA